MLLDEHEATFAVGSLQHTEPCIAQVRVEQIGDARIILDDHQRSFCVGHAGHAATLLPSPPCITGPAGGTAEQEW